MKVELVNSAADITYLDNAQSRRNFGGAHRAIPSLGMHVRGMSRNSLH
jgi:hypothetical protein